MTQPRTKKLIAAAVAAAAATALAGLALSTSANADSTPAYPAALADQLAAAKAAAKASPTSTAVPVPTPAPTGDPRSQTVGSGVLDGTPWSVTLTYYPTTPADFVPGEKSTGSLVCLRTTLNNQPTSPYGDCAGVKGLTAPSPSGMYGQHMLPDGASIFIAQPAADVATATMNFTNTAPTTATTATIPGTAFTAYAIPIPAASHMHTLDEYDTQHHTVGHQNF
ncbi:hypothetical protein P3T37_002159 [Kitasatospora sp. MAA4]|uniref:hypothetical protein n=1 Tax=Kitasatospora sp. MAA4 TaxID=3035093 RepID=UPI00247615E6|nr:hypothetical protein [Kitasatospora sp. MAA4]MDH6132773.1 hypothetical protein [Kitasatospora sp. MAA4]